MTIERGYIAQSVTLAAAVSLNNRYGFGADRIEQFAGLSYVSMGRYLQAPADKWPDMVRADCKKMRVDVDEDLLADRGRGHRVCHPSKPRRRIGRAKRGAGQDRGIHVCGRRTISWSHEIVPPGGPRSSARTAENARYTGYQVHQSKSRGRTGLCGQLHDHRLRGCPA